MKPTLLKTKILTAVSVIALMGSASVYAQTKSEAAVNKAVSEGQADISKAADQAFADIKAAFIDNDAKTEISILTIDPRKTANGMIGESIYDADGQSIGMVHDIIVDKAGKALMVIITDGKFFGMGKKAAFDYSVIAALNEEGDIIAPLTKEIIGHAMEFSYEKSEASETVHVIPDEAYSVVTLLKGQLINHRKETIAEIDNITFKNGQARDLIVLFDQVFGVGGDKAALPYSEAKLVRDDKAYDFELTKEFSAQFEAYKNTTK